jgi:hypothetical protein
MTRKLIFVICFLSPLLLLSQIGKAYRNYNDFINDKPLYQTDFRYVRIKSIKTYDAYKVKSDELVISGNEFKYSIWIISDRDYLYLNGTRNGCVDGYIKLKKGFVYSYFKAPARLTADQQESMNRYSSFGTVGGGIAGAIGGGIAGAIAASQTGIGNSQKIHHVLDLKNGQTFILTKNYIRALLTEYPSLLQKFDDTDNNDDIEVLKAYLELINELD